MTSYHQLIDTKFYQLLEKYIDNGNLTSYQAFYQELSKMKEKLLLLKDYSVKDAVDYFQKNLYEELIGSLKNVPVAGFSSGIVTKEGPELLMYYGRTSTNQNAKPFDETVSVDFASGTKLFTALQALKDAELKFINLNDHFSDLNVEYQQNSTIQEALTYFHKFETAGHIKNCSNEKEALDKLKKAKIVMSNTHVYDDINYMLVRQLLPDFECHFDVYFHRVLGLNNTDYDIKNRTLTGGSKSDINHVHDPKAKVISKCGSAGIYTDSHDLNLLYLGLDNETFLTRKSIDLLSTSLLKGEFLKDDNGNILLHKTTTNEYEPFYIKRGMMYRRVGKGISKTEVPIFASTHAFAAAGFTGSMALYDMENEYSLNLMTNPLSTIDEKPCNFNQLLNSAKEILYVTPAKLQLLQMVFETYYEKSDDFHKQYMLK